MSLSKNICNLDGQMAVGAVADVASCPGRNEGIGKSYYDDDDKKAHFDGSVPALVKANKNIVDGNDAVGLTLDGERSMRLTMDAGDYNNIHSPRLYGRQAAFLFGGKQSTSTTTTTTNTTTTTSTSPKEFQLGPPSTLEGGGGSLPPMQSSMYDTFMSKYESALAKEVAFISSNGFIYQGAGNVAQKASKLHYQIFVGNLTERTTLGDVARSLRVLGVYDVEHINIFHSPISNKSKGYCMVILSSKKSHSIVMTRLPQIEINGRRPEIALDFESAQAEFEAPQRKWPPTPFQRYENRFRPHVSSRFKSPQNYYSRNM